MSKSEVSEADIQALVDNQLSYEEEKRVCFCIQNNHQARKYYDNLRYQKQLLLEWWREEREN